MKNLSFIFKAALVLALFSGKANAQTSYTFYYTGSTQTISLPPGPYDIKMWGADGGSSNNSRQGRGGYSSGTLTLLSTTTLFIGVGSSPLYTGSTGLQPGGYNGGGSGYANSTGRAGGGATHIATLTGVLSALASNTAAVIIVAGGGGGDQNAGSIGHGGGLSGGGTYPGTQTGSSGSATGLVGTFGQGGNITSSYGGGGGGGWYGGGGNQNNAGSGGSGYIGGVTNGVTTMSAQTGFVTKPIATADGLVIITELCSITMSATGTNSNNAICAGSTVTLTTNAISNYSWSTNATTSSIVVSPIVTTVYSLTATSPSNCTAAQFYTVYVDGAVPSLTIANTANSGGICPADSVKLTATGATSYSWTGGVVNGATFAPTSSMDYTVTGTNACGSSTAMTSVSIHPLPSISLTASQPTVCTTQSISLCPSGGVSYTMSPLTPTCAPYYPFTTQTYTVRGSSALGCKNSAMATVIVTVTPVIPPVVTPTAICIGKTATLSATGASNYSWTPFTPPVTTSSLVVNPTSSITYSLTKWNGNCVNVDSVRLIVNPLPTVFAVANPSVVCALKGATLSAGGGVSYSWGPGNLPSGPQAANIVVFPPQTTEYTVTGSDGLCTNTAVVTVSTNPNPVITIQTNTSSICFGQSFSYSVSGADTYFYSNSPPDSPPMTATSGVLSPTTITNYSVGGTNQHGCSSGTTQLVMVYALPPITVSRTPTLVCSGFPSTLTASGVISNTVHSWSWAHGGTNRTSVVNPQSTSVYTVTGTNTVTSCMNTQTVSVAVYLPTFSVTPDTSICIKGNITLFASGALSYTWTGGPNPAVAPFYNVSPTVMTVYTVTATSPTLTLKCISARTISVGIYNQPNVTASSERSLACKGEPMKMWGNGADTYKWETLNITADTVVAYPLMQTIYPVIGTDVFGCKDTFQLLIYYSTCLGFEDHDLSKSLNIFPNPTSRSFVIDAPAALELKLYNAAGQVVQEINTARAGYYDVYVEDLPEGVYFLVGHHENMLISEKVIVRR